MSKRKITPRHRIREIMERDGVTQYSLAKDTGLTYVTIHSYFHGKAEPSLENLFIIAKALHVNPKELLNC